MPREDVTVVLLHPRSGKRRARAGPSVHTTNKADVLGSFLSVIDCRLGRGAVETSG